LVGDLTKLPPHKMWLPTGMYFGWILPRSPPRDPAGLPTKTPSFGEGLPSVKEMMELANAKRTEEGTPDVKQRHEPRYGRLSTDGTWREFVPAGDGDAYVTSNGDLVRRSMKRKHREG
jgi:hypothetical protein